MEPGVRYDVKESDYVRPLRRVLGDLVFVHEPPYWSRVGAHDGSANGLFRWGTDVLCLGPPEGGSFQKVEEGVVGRFERDEELGSDLMVNNFNFSEPVSVVWS